MWAGHNRQVRWDDGRFDELMGRSRNYFVVGTAVSFTAFLTPWFTTASGITVGGWPLVLHGSGWALLMTAVFAYNLGCGVTVYRRADHIAAQLPVFGIALSLGTIALVAISAGSVAAPGQGDPAGGIHWSPAVPLMFFGEALMVGASAATWFAKMLRHMAPDAALATEPQAAADPAVVLEA